MSAAEPVQAASPGPAAVPRRWIGAPDPAWDPTLTLMLGVVSGFGIFAVALRGGEASPWLAIPGLAVCDYAVFTVLHESMHGLAHRNRRPDLALGRVARCAPIGWASRAERPSS